MATLREVRNKDTQRKIEVMTAYINGAKIVSRAITAGAVDWHEIDFPSWAWGHFDYKVQDET